MNVSRTTGQSWVGLCQLLRSIFQPKDFTMQIHQSRWGFHPCSYQEFLQLKQLHKLLLRDRRATKRRQRWLAKTIYRQGPCPECVGTDQQYYEWVLGEYRLARRPCRTPEEVRLLDLPENWQQKLREFLELHSQAA